MNSQNCNVGLKSPKVSRDLNKWERNVKSYVFFLIFQKLAQFIVHHLTRHT